MAKSLAAVGCLLVVVMDVGGLCDGGGRFSFYSKVYRVKTLKLNINPHTSYNVPSGEKIKN